MLTNSRKVFTYVIVHIYFFFSVRGRVEFFKSCKLIGSRSGRNFPILPAHETIPPALETAGKLEMKSFYSGATKGWIFPLKMDLFSH